MCPYREKDPDPDGRQLAGTKDALGEATKLVQQLKQYAGDRIKTHLLAFEVSPHFTHSDLHAAWLLPATLDHSCKGTAVECCRIEKALCMANAHLRDVLERLEIC